MAPIQQPAEPAVTMNTMQGMAPIQQPAEPTATVNTMQEAPQAQLPNQNEGNFVNSSTENKSDLQSSIIQPYTNDQAMPISEEKPLQPRERTSSKVIEGSELEDLLFEEVTRDEAEKTTKVNKFYTFNRKNEEFQKLLDEEYERYQSGKTEGGFSNYIASKKFESSAELEGVLSAEHIEEMAKAREIFFDEKERNRQDGTNQNEGRQKRQLPPARAEESLEGLDKKARKKAKKEMAKEEKSGIAGKIVIGILFAFILALIAVLVIKFVAPTSPMAEMIDEFALKILEIFR